MVTESGAERYSFPELEELRRSLRALLRGHRDSLEAYFDAESGGFFHLIAPDIAPEPGDFSKASTATVVNFLSRSGDWHEGPWAGKETDLANAILSAKWDSAKLGDGNEFTTGFLLEALHSLQECGANLGVDGMKRVERECARMNVSLEKSGGISLQAHPEKAYLTQLVVRALLKWDRLEKNAAAAAQEWATRNLDRELVIVEASPSNADLFEIAYSVLLLKRIEEVHGVQGDIVIERDVIRHALNVFFDGQLDDGTWPRSKPLFHYPDVGNAYCFEYELLVQMLGERQLWNLLLPKLSKFKKALDALENRRYPLKPRGSAWASGHHRQLKSPESWSTASSLHFCFELDRLAAEEVRRQVFSEVGEEYSPPSRVSVEPEAIRLRESLLDSRFSFEGADYSLRTVIEDFLRPIASEVARVSSGRPFSRRTQVSAILFGPPGTSKTQLARLIANVLGWPLLKVDPSYLVREGLENVQSEANRLFSLLLETEEVVVLFDEIDELVRERGAAGEVMSRFLTTAMLPKWAALSDRRQIVYLVATNHLEVFDIAISRPGRFDVIVPVNPPTTEAKLSRWPRVREKLQELGLETDNHVLAKIELLTYAEFEAIEEKLVAAADKNDLLDRLTHAEGSSILRQRATPEPQQETEADWKTIIDNQEPKIRLPRVEGS